MKHDARRGMKHADIVGAYGRLALHVPEADAFNKALAGRHELGLSKDVQFAATAALVAEEATEREAARSSSTKHSTSSSLGLIRRSQNRKHLRLLQSRCHP